MSGKNVTDDKITTDRIDELMRLVFDELKARGGSGRPKEVLASVAKRVRLTPYELASTEYFLSRGLAGARWDTHVRFYTTDCVRAGFLTKSGGIWTLTEAGEKALKLPKGELIRSAARAYRRATAKKTDETSPDLAMPDDEKESPAKAIYDQADEDARAEIDAKIDSLDAYEFQNLVAELLKAMGYYVRSVSPPGADGGLDILAFRDPLGSYPPHIKVQVKHRDQKMDVKEIRQLTGILHKDSDIGLLVSSGGFTRDADREIAQASKHLDKIDRDRLLELWKQHYDKLSEQAKKYLPLVPVYFLAPPEA